MEPIYVSDKEAIPWQAMGPSIKTVIYYPMKPLQPKPMITVIIDWQTSGASDEQP